MKRITKKKENKNKQILRNRERQIKEERNKLCFLQLRCRYFRREREEKVGVVVTGTTFNGGGGGGQKFIFAATKVLRQCPLVLLLKVGLVKVRRLEVEKVG
jgi:hypothetical protein